ncbi:hypothetical protein M5K25_014690 [Dendrobium thyrsiflorum]|uniref:Uncharacterized protein n=1 Tax=Dendrobium thyrsiflorum TaxID=117978 RepID=A0ABD0UV53_DENTH
MVVVTVLISICYGFKHISLLLLVLMIGQLNNIGITWDNMFLQTKRSLIVTKLSQELQLPSEAMISHLTVDEFSSFQRK